MRGRNGAIGVFAGCVVGAAGLAVSSGVADAELPEALDRVPLETPVVAVIPDVSELLNDVNKFNQTFREALPPELQQSLAMVGFAQLVLSQPGFDPQGSAAIALYPEAEGDAAMDMEDLDGGDGLAGAFGGMGIVAVLPVSDFQAFRQAPIAQGARMENGILSLDLMGQTTVYIRDLDGYIALSAERAQTEAFDRSAGRMGDHEARLGWSGSGVAESNDLTIYAHIPALREGIEAQIAELDQQAQMVTVMGGPQAAQGVQLIETMVRNFARDAEAGLLGLDLSEGGIGFDLGANFREDSELAGIFSEGGSSGSLLENLPQMEFLLAYALDNDSKTVSTLASNWFDMSEDAGQEGEAANPMNAFGFDKDMMEKTDGSAAVLGTSPAMGMAGMLSNFVGYVASDDPGAFVGVMERSIDEVDGMSGGGLKFKSDWSERVELEEHGLTVDSYTIAVESDPESAPPGAMGMDPTMAMSMMYGVTGGPNGYVKTMDTGIYYTLSKNGKLLKQATEAGADGISFASQEGIANVSKRMLPDGRVAEGYLSVNGMLDMARPFAAMAGPEVAQLLADVPDFDPVGASIASKKGGMTARLFMPGDVIGFMADLGQKMQQQFGDGQAEPQPQEEAPSF